MTARPPQPPDAVTPEHIRDRAAHWSDVLRHRGGQPQLRDAFEQWRDEDPAHADAFARVDGVHRLLRAARDSDEMRRVEQETLALVGRRRSQRRRGYIAAAAACLVATVVAVALLPQGLRDDLRHLPAHARYALAGEHLHRTGVGEQRRLILADGSVLTLNTDSRVVVGYGDAQRRLRLLGGQALFEVAHDPTRPFVVTAGGRSIRALGTVFDVRYSQDRLAVTLLEGRVAVDEVEAAGAHPSPPPAGAAQAGSHVLEPGEQLLAMPARPGRAGHEEIRSADLSRAVAWRSGQLIFRDDRLVDVIAEINRYSHQQLRLADPALAQLRISGIVNVGQTDVFIETMTRYYPVRIQRADRQEVVLAAR